MVCLLSHFSLVNVNQKRGCVNHRRNSTKQSNHQPSHIMTDCTHSIRSSQIDFIYRRWPSDTRIDINLWGCEQNHCKTLSLFLFTSLLSQLKLFQDIFNFDTNDCTPLVNQVMLCRIGLPAQHPWQPFNWGELFSHSSLLMNSKWTVFRWNIDIFKMKIKVL